MGHNGLIYFSAKTKDIEIIEPGGIGFGIADSARFRAKLSENQITCQRGDIFVFLTDGFLEAMNQEKQVFGEEQICAIIKAHAADSAEQIIFHLQAAIQQYIAGKPNDDATGIVVKIVD